MMLKNLVKGYYVEYILSLVMNSCRMSFFPITGKYCWMGSSFLKIDIKSYILIHIKMSNKKSKGNYISFIYLNTITISINHLSQPHKK